MEQLVERVAREKEAYDAGTIHRESSALQARFFHVFACPNSQWGERYLDGVVAQYGRDKDLLDYGCYDGWMTPRFMAVSPRTITGLDISENAIAEANAKFGHDGKFYAGDAHAMPFPDGSFDLVTGRGILHHLDLELALKEIRRVLRPGGTAIFVEPLADNPGAKLLRALTPKARTTDEKPLTRANILRSDALLGSSSHRFLNLISVPVAMLTSLTPLGPNNLALRLADRTDRLLAQTPFKYWMRSVILVWHKSGPT